MQDAHRIEHGDPINENQREEVVESGSSNSNSDDDDDLPLKHPLKRRRRHDDNTNAMQQQAFKHDEHLANRMTLTQLPQGTSEVFV